MNEASNSSAPPCIDVADATAGGTGMGPRRDLITSALLVLVLVIGAFPEPARPQQAEHEYREGTRTIKLTLLRDLVLDYDDERGMRAPRRVGARPGPDSPQRLARASTSTPEIPVFATETGELLAPVGGIIIILDESWNSLAIETFLASHNLSDDATPLVWLRNGYSVRTEPGMAALELANRLATVEGVLLSVPNWWREVEQR